MRAQARHKLLVKKNMCIYKKTLNIESASCELRVASYELRVTPLFCEYNSQLALLSNLRTHTRTHARAHARTHAHAHTHTHARARARVYFTCTVHVLSFLLHTTTGERWCESHKLELVTQLHIIPYNPTTANFAVVLSYLSMLINYSLQTTPSLNCLNDL